MKRSTLLFCCVALLSFFVHTGTQAQPCIVLRDSFSGTVTPNQTSVFSPSTVTSSAIVGGPATYAVHTGSVYADTGLGQLIFFAAEETAGEVSTTIPTVPGRDYEVIFTTAQHGDASTHTLEISALDGPGLGGAALGSSGPIGITSTGHFVFTALSDQATLRILGTMGTPNTTADIMLSDIFVRRLPMKVVHDRFNAVTPDTTNIFAPGNFTSSATVGGDIVYTVEAGSVQPEGTFPGHVTFFGGMEVVGDIFMTFDTIVGREYHLAFATQQHGGPSTHAIEVSAIDGTGLGGVVLASSGPIGTDGVSQFNFVATSAATTIRALGIVGAPNFFEDIWLTELVIRQMPEALIDDHFTTLTPDETTLVASQTFTSTASVGGDVTYTVNAGFVHTRASDPGRLVLFGAQADSADLYMTFDSSPGRNYEVVFHTKMAGGLTSHAVEASAHDGTGLAGALLGSSGPVGIDSMGAFTITALSTETTVRFLGFVGLPNASEDLEIDSLTITPCPPTFQRGDTNTDGTNNVADAVFLLGYLFPGPLGQSDLTCLDASDANDDGGIDLGDVVSILVSLFGNPAAPLPAPFGECGEDPTQADDLGCDLYGPCL